MEINQSIYLASVSPRALANILRQSLDKCNAPQYQRASPIGQGTRKNFLSNFLKLQNVIFKWFKKRSSSPKVCTREHTLLD